MNKKVFVSILIMICFMFGLNSVKAQEGEGNIGSKTTFYKYCYGDDCRYIVIGTEGDEKTLYDSDGHEMDDDSNFLVLNLNNNKYLHRIKMSTTGITIIDSILNYYINSNSKSQDEIVSMLKNSFLSKGWTYGDDFWLGFTIESKTVYTLLYTYGSDSIEYGDESKIGLKIKEIDEATADIIDKENMPDINYGGGNVGCAVLSKPIKDKINWVLDFIKYAGTALAIILGAADFLKATLADDDNASKKAFQRFINRIIAAVLLFLIPLIIQFLFTTINNPLIKIPGFNIDDPTCGIGVSENQ